MERILVGFPPLAPRLERVLSHLLDGDSEKQIAFKLALSRHTVHVYTKNLYRKFDVSSRGELLALFLRTALVGRSRTGANRSALRVRWPTAGVTLQRANAVMGADRAHGTNGTMPSTIDGVFRIVVAVK